MDVAGREGNEDVGIPMRLPRGALVLAAVAVLVAPLPVFLSVPARAQAGPTIAVTPVHAPIGVGEEAPFLVRVTGADPAALDLRYEVEGGVLVGLLAPAQVGPETYEATVYVRRDTPGTVTLTAFLGTTRASASVEAILAGRIRVRLVVHDVVAGASRSWPVEVVDGAGTTVAQVHAASGGGVSGEADTPLLPYGIYLVRLARGNDTGLSCEEGRFFAVREPAGGAAAVAIAGPRTEVRFSVDVCPVAGLAPPTPTPVEAVAGERTPGPTPTPRPPAAGTGFASSGEPSEGWALFLGACLFAGGAALLAARRPSR